MGNLIFFLQQVEEAFDFWGTPEGDLVHPAECMQQLPETVRRHRVNVDGNVCTVMVMEGMIFPTRIFVKDSFVFSASLSLCKTNRSKRTTPGGCWPKALRCLS
ncbi:unnamed protein product [Prunus armeniaca]